MKNLMMMINESDRRKENSLDDDDDDEIELDIDDEDNDKLDKMTKWIGVGIIAVILIIAIFFCLIKLEVISNGLW